MVRNQLSPSTMPSFIAPLPNWAPRHRPLVQRPRLTCSVAPPAPGESPSVSQQPSVPPNLSVSPRLLAFLSRAEEGDAVAGLSRAEDAFSALKSLPEKASLSPSQELVSTSPHPLLTGTASHDYDVLVAGGTLGILYAAALQHQGWRVAVIERGPLRGRSQEWNISRHELRSLIDCGVVTTEQMEAAIMTECSSPGRVALRSKEGLMRQITVSGVLDVGVAPDILISNALDNFQNDGGTVLQFTAVDAVSVAPDGVAVSVTRKKAGATGALGAGGTGIPGEDDPNAQKEQITARLLVDAMGAFSPIARQARAGRRPDAVCITVGSCIQSPKWSTALDAPDILAAPAPIDGDLSAQYFWEAFPVGRDPSARTTYMFSYGSCDEQRQTLTSALEHYIASVPEYQGLDLDLDGSEQQGNDETVVKRVLFGFFPSYYRSETPAGPAFDRVLGVGDAGGLQSPISFGGFGCCCRHLPRISTAVDEALSRDLLQRKHLAMVQWYLPSLAVTGLFHKAMAVPYGMRTAGSLLDEFGINDVLWENMRAMKSAGTDVQLSFLRDVVSAEGLSKTLFIMAARNPALAIKLSLGYIGVAELVDWSKHYAALILYAAGKPLVESLRNVSAQSAPPERAFWLNRMVDAVTYGSGSK